MANAVGGFGKCATLSSIDGAKFHGSAPSKGVAKTAAAKAAWETYLKHGRISLKALAESHVCALPAVGLVGRGPGQDIHTAHVQLGKATTSTLGAQLLSTQHAMVLSEIGKLASTGTCLFAPGLWARHIRGLRHRVGPHAQVRLRRGDCAAGGRERGAGLPSVARRRCHRL